MTRKDDGSGGYEQLVTATTGRPPGEQATVIFREN